MPSLAQFFMKITCLLVSFLATIFPSIDHECEVCNPVCAHVGGVATCINQAVCDLCGEEYGGFAEHLPGDEQRENSVDATCDKNGSFYSVIYCTVCESELSRKTTTIEKYGHLWSEDVISSEPTCTQDGYITRTCFTCGTGITEIVKGSALGHSFGEWETVIVATCAAEGEAKKECDRCDATEIKTLAALGHDEVAHEAKAPTCTEKGWDAYVTCSRCDYTTYSEKAKLGHDYNAVTTAPTCEADGYTTHTCSRCDNTYTDGATDKLGHNYEGQVTTEPTCTAKGEKTFTCKNDASHTYTEEVAALGHNMVTDAAVAPTCTATGLTEGKHCSICKIVTIQQTIVDNFGHKYDNELDAICNTCNEKRVVDEILLSISQNSIFGYVKGLEIGSRESASVILYNTTNSYTSSVGINNEYFFGEIPEGTYYLKIEVAGYKIPSPIKIDIADDINILQHLSVAKVTDSDFYYQWKADDTYFGYEESATVPSKKTFTFLDEVIFVNDSNATAKLQRNYKIVLSNEALNWSSDYASRLLELVENIYEFPKSIPSKWILTADKIDDDIEITYGIDYTVVRISKSAFENAIPRKAEYNGLKGTYFSNRLYHALIRYATKEGTNINYIDCILQHDYGCSIIVTDYAALTAGITNETNAAFEMFKPEELLAILEMFAEMPQGFHYIENLEYLVRRIDGSKNPIYPNAAAVSWIYAEHGYIEFMDNAFLGSEVEDTFRLVLHEKSHFLWEHVFSDELKAKWIEIGGWYETPNDADGWSTTKETEFVTAYAHAINPDEDMAESIAYYILMPDKLESRSPAKYAFIRDYIMNGEIYVTQIREDMTFEVYNLYPDYNYPGKIVGVDIQVSGAPEEDKKVTVTVTLDTNGDPSFGANRAFMRIKSDNDTFYDLWVSAIDKSNSVLRGTVTFSKYACNGYWYNEEIELSDITGNQRFVGVDNYGWKLYINNPLADSEPPQYVKDSVRVEVRHGEFSGQTVTYVDVIFKATDNIGLDTVYCSIANNTHNSYQMDEFGNYNKETGEAIITYIFAEYMQSGEYSVNYIMLKDYAENTSMFYFYSDGTGAGYPATFVFNSDNSDYEAPTLDVNRITITATPTHPENPNGETAVHIEYYVKDNVSGLGVVKYRLLDPLGNTHFEYHYHENFYTTFFEGDPTAWKKYEIDVTLPEGSAPGKWGLLEIYVSDKAGNFITYNFLEMLHFQVSSK